MEYIPNFGEFYQRSLVSIGENDKVLAIEKQDHLKSLPNCTHWLIALEGTEIYKGADFYQWRVFVYPAIGTGYFNYKDPYLTSEFFATIDDALVYTRDLELKANEDQLFTIYSN